MVIAGPKKAPPRAAVVAAVEDWTFLMPDAPRLIRTARAPSASASALMLLAAGLALGGCSGGDFGRTREDFRNDDMHRWLGAEATGSAGLQARYRAFEHHTI